MKGKSVAVVDICFDRKTVTEMNETCAEFVVLDHHKTSQDKMEGLDFCVFDMKRSGCQMAYDYFYPMEVRRGCGCEFHIQLERPVWLDHIGSRDLWDFSDEDTKPFSAAIFHLYGNLSQDETVKAINEIAEEDPRDHDELIDMGNTILKFQQKQIDSACHHAVKCSMYTPDDVAHVVWASDNRLHRSEIGNALAQRDDGEFAVLYSYSLKGDEWWISLRSLKEKADVGQISALYEKGGGHTCAAGFTWKGDIRDLIVPIE
jgi:nanoRNase/pAp phosphatase (c-di-AMP/oligoRNAs hydrolase)